MATNVDLDREHRLGQWRKEMDIWAHRTDLYNRAMHEAVMVLRDLFLMGAANARTAQSMTVPDPPPPPPELPDLGANVP